MRTHVFFASTAFGLASLAAAAADDMFPDASRRVLVLSNNAVFPETAYGVADVAGMAPLIEEFDAVYSYNDAVAPYHPMLWQPQVPDRPIWERSLRSLWALEGDLHLVVENVHAAPAFDLCQTFVDATIDVYAEGLFSYGPTRNALPPQVGMRVQRLLHLDLVPGVRPLLLREHHVRSQLISTESFHKVLADIGAGDNSIGPPAAGSPTAVLLGQYASAVRLLTAQEELQLYLEMVEGTVAAGFAELVFKAHPRAPAGVTGPLVRRAGELGARLTVRDEPELVETWYASGEVGLVVGCFSTALATAAHYGVPAARVGTELLLERLDPYQTGNRMAATVIAATVPRLDSLTAGADHRPISSSTLTTEQLVTTVGYLMQPSRNRDLRDVAAGLLGHHLDDLRPYISRDRLTELDLPGGHRPDPPRRPRLSRRLGTALRRLLPARRPE